MTAHGPLGTSTREAPPLPFRLPPAILALSAILLAGISQAHPQGSPDTRFRGNGFTSPSRIILEAKSAGMDTLRGPIYVYGTGPLGVDDNIDAFIAKLADFNTADVGAVPMVRSVLFVPDDPNDPGAGGQACSMLPEDPNDYAGRLESLASTFAGQIDSWEIDIEYPRVWIDPACPTSNTKEDFVEYLRISADAIRAGNPDATVIMTGFANLMPALYCDGLIPVAPFFQGTQLTPQWCQDNYDGPGGLKEWLEYPLLNGSAHFDAVDIHTYGDYEYIQTQIEWIQSRLNPDKEIVALEGGGPFTAANEPYTQAEEARSVVQYFAVSLNEGMTSRTWGTVPSPEFGQAFLNLGILDLDGGTLTRKPSYYAYEQMKNRLGGYQVSEEVWPLSTFPDSSMFGYRFIKDCAATSVYWKISPTEELRLLPLWDLGATSVDVTDVITTTTSQEPPPTTYNVFNNGAFIPVYTPVYVTENSVFPRHNPFGDVTGGIGGTVSGSYRDTRLSDDETQDLQEVYYLGGPDSRLDHTWVFEGIPAGTHTLTIEGWRTANAEGENFQFYRGFSESGFFVKINGAVIDQSNKRTVSVSMNLTTTACGPLYIKVLDTNPVGGTIETLYLDRLWISTSTGGGPPLL